jgi:hypothetical protein
MCGLCARCAGQSPPGCRAVKNWDNQSCKIVNYRSFFEAHKVPLYFAQRVTLVVPATCEAGIKRVASAMMTNRLLSF